MSRTAALTLLCTLVLGACRDAPPEELIDLGPLPPWSLQSEAGQPLGNAELAGKPWVANFLFTSCPSSCPPLARATADLQARVKKWQSPGEPPSVRLISVTVDPVTDTPDVLTAFARKYGADPQLWSFATGDYAVMERLVTDGFLLPIQRSDRPVRGQHGHEGAGVLARPTPLDTAHSLRFVLVDGAGHIRGLYNQDADSLAKLDAALQYFVRHP